MVGEKTPESPSPKSQTATSCKPNSQHHELRTPKPEVRPPASITGPVPGSRRRRSGPAEVARALWTSRDFVARWVVCIGLI